MLLGTVSLPRTRVVTLNAALGPLDYRVPDAQGLGMYTALRRRGVPARYLWFPDEGHWVLKPQNRLVWWREMHGWLDKYLKGSSGK